jgi:ribonuclease HI
MIAAYCKIVIGISQRFLRGSTAFKAEERDEQEAWDEEQAGALIANEQAEYTAYIAGLIYARGIIKQARAVANKRQQFWALSSD